MPDQFWVEKEQSILPGLPLAGPGVPCRATGAIPPPSCACRMQGCSTPEGKGWFDDGLVRVELEAPAASPLQPAWSGNLGNDLQAAQTGCSVLPASPWSLAFVPTM